MKNLIKLITLLMAAVMLLSACNAVTPADAVSDGSATEEAYKSALMKKDTLVVGTSPDYAPYESLENGQLVGFDIELMNAVGKSMGLTVEWSQMDFDNILVAVPAGQVDIGVSAFTYSDKRAESVLFNKIPYLDSAQVAFVKADSDINSVEDFAGKHFYAGLGTTGEMALDEIIAEYEDVRKTNSMDYQIAFEMLNQGQLDGVICDKAVGEGYIETMGLRAIDPPLIEEQNLIITRKGNEALIDALDTAIEAFMKTDEYKEIRAKYGF